MSSGEICYGGMRSWAKVALCHLGGKAGACSVTTGAEQLVAAIPCLYRLNFRQLKGLMSERLRRFRGAVLVSERYDTSHRSLGSGQGCCSSARPATTGDFSHHGLPDHPGLLRLGAFFARFAPGASEDGGLEELVELVGGAPIFWWRSFIRASCSSSFATVRSLPVS
jgi:hypothetical protein